MKRPLKEMLLTEYEKYHNECKHPKTFYEWSLERKERTVKSLEDQLEAWRSFTPKAKVVIKRRK